MTCSQFRLRNGPSGAGQRDEVRTRQRTDPRPGRSKQPEVGPWTIKRQYDVSRTALDKGTSGPYLMTSIFRGLGGLGHVSAPDCLYLCQGLPRLSSAPAIGHSYLPRLRRVRAGRGQVPSRQAGCQRVLSDVSARCSKQHLTETLTLEAGRVARDGGRGGSFTI